MLGTLKKDIRKSVQDDTVYTPNMKCKRKNR